MRSKQIPEVRGGWLGWKNVREFAEDSPEFLLKLAKEYGGIVQFRLGFLSFCLVTDPEYVREVLVTQADKFEKSARDKRIMGRFLGQGLVTSDGEYHARQRKLSQPAFRKKLISGYADTMMYQTEHMLDTWEDGQPLNIAEKMNELTMYIVSETLFHMDVSDVTKRVGEAIVFLQEEANRDFTSPFFMPKWLPTPRNIQANRAIKFLDDIIYEMIAKRRQEEGSEIEQTRHDLLSSLLEAKDDDGERMTDLQLRDELLTLFVAGHETTSNALTWTWYLLSQHPEVERKLHQELDDVLQGRPVTLEDLAQLPYTHQILKESMRICPPVWTLNTRCNREDVEIDGYVIPKGTLVFVSPYALHHHPNNFENPHVFDPDRFLPEREEKIHRYAYIPFGAGHRVCIGNSFAMMESALILARIAQKYRLLLEPGQTIKKLAHITMSPEHGIRMQLQAREACRSAAAEDNPVLVARHTKPLATPQVSGCPYHRA